MRSVSPTPRTSASRCPSTASTTAPAAAPTAPPTLTGSRSSSLTRSWTRSLSWTDAETEASDFQSAGNRYKFFTTTMPEHNVTAAADGFSTQIAALGGAPTALTDPGTITYSWCSSVVKPTLGLGPTSVYWLSGLSQRSTASTSAIAADDAAIPTASEAEQRSTSAVDPPDAPPMVVVSGSWTPGPTPPSADALTLNLTNVRTLSVNTYSARLPEGTATITSDGPGLLTLTHLRAGTIISGVGAPVPAVNGKASVSLPKGTTHLSWRA